MNLRQSFALPYNGGTLWYACLDELGCDVPLIRERMELEEKLLLRPSNSAYVVYHLYNTELDGELAAFLVSSLKRCQGHVLRLALVGLSKSTKVNYRRALKAHSPAPNILIKAFDDLELAKGWLLGKQ